MMVEKNKVISLSYELKVNGQTVETVGADSPLSFLYGVGNLLPKFEENLDGLSINDDFDFELISHDAYGPVKDEAIVDVPLQAFEVDGEIDKDLLKEGNQIPMLDQSGNRLNGKILKFDDENVTILNREIEILLDDILTVHHGQVDYRNVSPVCLFMPIGRHWAHSNI